MGPENFNKKLSAIVLANVAAEGHRRLFDISNLEHLLRALPAALVVAREPANFLSPFVLFHAHRARTVAVQRLPLVREGNFLDALQRHRRSHVVPGPPLDVGGELGVVGKLGFHHAQEVGFEKRSDVLIGDAVLFQHFSHSADDPTHLR